MVTSRHSATVAKKTAAMETLKIATQQSSLSEAQRSRSLSLYLFLFDIKTYLNLCVYDSGTSLIRTPMGQKKVSLLVRCPHFRG